MTIVFVQSKVNDTIDITFKQIYFEDFSAFLLRSLFGRKKPRLPRVIVDIPRLITLRYSPMGQLKDRLTYLWIIHFGLHWSRGVWWTGVVFRHLSKVVLLSQIIHAESVNGQLWTERKCLNWPHRW